MCGIKESAAGQAGTSGTEIGSEESRLSSIVTGLFALIDELIRQKSIIFPLRMNVAMQKYPVQSSAHM